MSCTTCDHTMDCLSPSDLVRPGIFWCPRCGTVKFQTDIPQSGPVYVPKLVERCRQFTKWVNSAGLGKFFPEGILQELHRLGIAESIHRPEDRP